MSLRDLKTEKKKNEIIESAIKIIEQKGFYNTTMEEIAANLLMTKGSLYYYFKNKQDLLFQSQALILSQSVKNIEDVIQEDLDPEATLKTAMQTHIKYLIQEQATFAMAVEPEQYFTGQQLTTILNLRKTYASYMDTLVLNLMQTKLMDTSDIKIIRNLILGAMNWLIQWYSLKGKLDSSEMAEKITHHLMKMINDSEKK